MLINLDFNLYKGKEQIKGFTFRNDDGTYYDLTGSVVSINFYKDGDGLEPLLIEGVLGSNSNMQFTFNTLDLVNEGKFSYVIIETKLDSDQVILLRGSITVVPYTVLSMDIDSYLQVELPHGFTLDNNFINQKIRYWRLFLQDGFDISDSNLDIDLAWPILVKVLIAKLVAYDALVLAIKGNLLTIFGSNANSTGTTTSSKAGGIKAITTGPSKVEFHAAGETMSQIIKSSSGTSAGSTSILSTLAEDICGLARKLTVKLPMCAADKMVRVFQYYKKPQEKPFIDICNNQDNQVSRG